MKILQLSTKVPYPPKDGGAAGIFIFSKTLVKLGHSVAILAFNPPKHFVSSGELNDLPEGICIHSVEIDTRPTFLKALKNLVVQSIPYQVERFVNEKYKQKLIEVLKQFQPDVVQLEGVYLCPYIPVIRNYSRASVVLRAHNIEFVLWQGIAANETNLLKKIYLKIQAKRIKKYEIKQLDRVDGITTVTPQDLLVIDSYHPKPPSKVIPFGIEPKDRAVSDKVNTEAISFIGALDWMPNQEAIVWFVHMVWPLVREKYPHLKFHIAGRNAPPSLKSTLEQQENVVFHGEVPDATLFLNQFSILVVPLFAGSGIRVKIIEAMEHKLAVIASAKAVDGIPAISGQHLLIANTADEFVKEISRLIENPVLITKISDNALNFVREKFDILAICSELTDFYTQIAND
jgi:glycosyltransferase involved in cell wall biosynthesis